MPSFWGYRFPMPYYNVTARMMFDSCYSNFQGEPDEVKRRAIAWAQAVNTEQVWVVVQRCFERMQDGTMKDQYPDPWFVSPKGRKPLDADLADKLIAEIDADFELERGRFPQGKGPEFSRLPSHARMAFAQELYVVTKTDGELEEEAMRWIREGQTVFPPLEGAAHENESPVV